MFAPAHHGPRASSSPVRKELAVRTIFNFLGPLTNPAGAARQVIGVSDPASWTRSRARWPLGAGKALVVSSEDGLDEMSTSGTTTRRRGRRRRIRSYEVRPEDVGLRRSAFEAVAGGTPGDNAAVTRGSSPARPARRATSRCSTPAPRSTSPAERTALPRRCARSRGGDRLGRAHGARGARGADRELAPGRPS